MVKKPVRFRCLTYLAFVRTKTCLVCARPADHAHHVVTRGAGGSDLTAVPLCVRHHAEIHQVGTQTFALRHDVDLVAARLRLLEAFIEEKMS